MTSFVDYKIFPDKRLIVEYYKGEIDLSRIIDFKEIEVLDKAFDPDFNIIADLRDTKFDLNSDEVLGYINYIKKERKNYGMRSTVFLTDNPNQVVISTLFDNLKSDLPISVFIVSTVKSAIEILNLEQFNYQDIIDWIKDIRKKVKKG